MTNPERGEVALVARRIINGKEEEREYTLKLSMNASVALQTRRKKTMQQLLGEVDTLDFATIRDLAHVLLQKYHADEIKTVEQAGDVIDDAGGLVPFLNAFRALMSINEPPPAQAGSENPLTAQTPSIGDGSTSMPVAAA